VRGAVGTMADERGTPGPDETPANPVPPSGRGELPTMPIPLTGRGPDLPALEPAGGESAP
jgi:hypothetical protein